MRLNLSPRSSARRSRAAGGMRAGRRHHRGVERVTAGAGALADAARREHGIADHLARQGDVALHGLDHLRDGDGVVAGMPAVVIGRQREGRVAELGLAREPRLGQGGHPDHVDASSCGRARSPRGWRTAALRCTRRFRRACTVAPAGEARGVSGVRGAAGRPDRRRPRARPRRRRRTSSAAPPCDRRTASGRTRCPGAISSFIEPTAETLITRVAPSFFSACRLAR